MSVCALFVVFSACALFAAAAPVNAPAGYIVAAQYKCDDFTCPDWELDLSRVETEFHPKDQYVDLATLIPKSPVAKMSFPVFTAYHESSRTFSTLGLTDGSSGVLWAHRIANDVNSSQQLSATKFSFPEQNGPVVGLQALSNSSVVVIFQGGLVGVVDTKTGLVPLTNLLSNPKYTSGKVLTATAINPDDDTLYAFITDEYNDNLAISSFNARTRVATLNPFTLKHERMGPETVMHMVWVASKKALFMFMVGTNLGFDSIISIDPATAEGSFIMRDLTEKMLGFTCDPSTKACDALQTSAYDAVQDRVYFQATQYESSDDQIGTTVMAFLDLSHREIYLNIAVDPFSFGVLDWKFVPVVSTA